MRKELTVDEFSPLRALTRSLESEAKLAAMQGRADDAATIYLDIVRLGRSSAQGGLIIDELLGMAIEGIGLQGIAQVRRSLSPAKCSEIIQRLEAIDRERESSETLVRRDQLWEMHTYGWLSALPEDPFSARPLVYRRGPKGYVLYSVGMNGQDDGGKPRDPADWLGGDLLLDEMEAASK